MRSTPCWHVDGLPVPGCLAVAQPTPEHFDPGEPMPAGGGGGRTLGVFADPEPAVTMHESSTAAAPRAEPRRSSADRIARQLLRIEDADPKALLSLKGSIWLSAIRCVITYAVLPALAPFVGWIGVLARPVSVLLVLTAMVLSVHSLRRVWLADWGHRWAYTAFIAVVLALLTVVLVSDVRALLAA